MRVLMVSHGSPVVVEAQRHPSIVVVPHAQRHAARRDLGEALQGAGGPAAGLVPVARVECRERLAKIGANAGAGLIRPLDRAKPAT